MSRSSIKAIRQARNVPAFIGRMVTYNGHPYRIAWAEGDALILRSELRVHPKDDNLNYAPSDSIHEGTNQQRIRSLEKDIKQLRHRIQKAVVAAEYRSAEDIKRLLERILNTEALLLQGQNNPPVGWHIIEALPDKNYRAVCGITFDSAGRVYSSTTDEISLEHVCEECRKIKGITLE